MIKKILSASVFFALAFGALTASAQGTRVEVKTNASASGTPAQVKVRSEAQAQVTGSRATSSEARSELKLNIAQRKVENTERVFLAMAKRLETLISRVESRIAKFEAGGASTIDAKIHLGEAKKHLDMAEASIEAFAAIDLGEGTWQANFQNIRAAAQEVKKHFRETHTHLMMTVRSLKASGGVRGGVNATTTASTSPSN